MIDELSKLPPPIESDGMNIHLSYIRRDIDQINTKIDRLTSGYVTRVDYDEHLKQDEDHEKRIRLLETATTKIMTYGSVGILVLSVVEFLLSRFLN